MEHPLNDHDETAPVQARSSRTCQCVFFTCSIGAAETVLTRIIIIALGTIGGVVLEMKGVLKVYYFAPNSPSNPNPTGFIKVPPRQVQG